jgi:hypothetical protein
LHEFNGGEKGDARKTEKMRFFFGGVDWGLMGLIRPISPMGFKMLCILLIKHPL